MESQRQQQQRHENRNTFKQKTCLQLQISVCHVIIVNRCAVVKTFEMSEREKLES